MEGPERYAESRTGPAVSEACSQSITQLPHATHTTINPRSTSPLKTTMVVSAVDLMTDPAEEFRSDSLEAPVIDQSRPRGRYQAPAHRRL